MIEIEPITHRFEIVGPPQAVETAGKVVEGVLVGLGLSSVIEVNEITTELNPELHALSTHHNSKGVPMVLKSHLRSFEESEGGRPGRSTRVWRRLIRSYRNNDGFWLHDDEGIAFALRAEAIGTLLLTDLDAINNFGDKSIAFLGRFNKALVVQPEDV